MRAWRRGVAAGALVAANVAASTALLILDAWPHRPTRMPGPQVWAWTAAGCAAAYLLLRTVLGDSWPTRGTRRLVRLLVAAWLLVPVADVAVRPVPGWDFSDCGTLLHRADPARHPPATPDLVAFVAECDHAYAVRWVQVAVAAALCGALLAGYGRWALRHPPAQRRGEPLRQP